MLWWNFILHQIKYLELHQIWTSVTDILCLSFNSDISFRSKYYDVNIWPFYLSWAGFNGYKRRICPDNFKLPRIFSQLFLVINSKKKKLENMSKHLCKEWNYKCEATEILSELLSFSGFFIWPLSQSKGQHLVQLSHKRNETSLSSNQIE